METFLSIFRYISMEKNLRLQVADRIKTVLREKKWRQQDLVNASGITKSYLSRILSGTINITVDTIEVLEKALNEKIIRP